jgi:hypothetical protein
VKTDTQQIPDWLLALDTSSILATNGKHIETLLEAAIEVYAAKWNLEIHQAICTDGKMDVPAEDVHKYLTENLGGRRYYTTHIPLGRDKKEFVGWNKSIYVFPHGLAIVQLYGKSSPYNNGGYFGTDEFTATALRDYFSAHHVENKKEGRVYVIVRTSQGNEIRNIGVAGVKFEPENYEADVRKDYEHIIQDLNNNDPCGRLVLLDGPPGTGKTYMVRSLLSACPDTTFVLIPPQMVSELSGPELITSLTAVRERDSKHPIVLVIEDGERVLLPRGNDNDMSVSSMLNTCDGIFGTIVDLRVIVTTNEKNERVDKALKRSGRLCRSLHIGELSPSKAAEVFKRITGEDRVFKEKTPLCDIYRLARDRGWKAAPARGGDAPVGFRMDEGVPAGDGLEIGYPDHGPMPGDDVDPPSGYIEVEIEVVPGSVFDSKPAANDLGIRPEEAQVIKDIKDAVMKLAAQTGIDLPGPDAPDGRKTVAQRAAEVPPKDEV